MKKPFRCPLCDKKYVDRPGIYSHMTREHLDQIPNDIPVDQYYYDLTHPIKKHLCIVCRKEVPWNSKTHKYSRLCGSKECDLKIRETFQKRMMPKYHTDNLAASVEHQKKMLAGRHISGEYQWENGSKTSYTGSYELDFLEYCESVLDLSSNDIIGPSPNTYEYFYEGKRHFYIPDFFLIDYNVEVEIKDGGKNPNMHPKIIAVDKVKENLKDKVLEKQRNVHYIKIVNKNYNAFLNLMNRIRNDELTEEEIRDKIKIF